MAQMQITELRRSGKSVLEATAYVFTWDGATHSMMEGALNLHLQVRTNRKVPAGSSTPVEQILSASWQPFEIHGEWRDAWAGQGFAHQTHIDFAKLVGRTPFARFTVDQQSLVGIITDLHIRYETRDRIGWSITFSPHANELVGDPRDYQTTALGSVPISQHVQNVTDATEALVTLSTDTAGKVPAATDDFLDQLKGLDELTSAKDRLDGISDDGLNVDVVRTLLTLATQFRRVNNAALEAAFAVSDRRDELTLAFAGAIPVLQFEVWSRQTFVQAVRAAGLARYAEADMRRRASRNPRAIHVCSDGESLERISLRYYGTANNWRAIYTANSLSTWTLTGGQELLIPERV